MNKNQFVSELKKKTGFTGEQAYKAINGVFDVIAEALEKGESINIQSFGTFEAEARLYNGVSAKFKVQVSELE